MRSDLRFLFDVGVGTIVESWVASQGFDVRTVRQIDPGMSDGDILDLAEREARVVVTMDKDFGELVFGSDKKHRGVLLLRLESATAAEKLAIVKSIFAEHLEKLQDHFCVYQKNTLRIRSSSR